jgi:hypothetical protein
MRVGYGLTATTADWSTWYLAKRIHDVPVDVPGDVPSDIPHDQIAEAKIRLPVEVLSASGFTVEERKFKIPFVPVADTGIELRLRIHSVNYEGKVSLQLNDSAWITLNRSYAKDDAPDGVQLGHFIDRNSAAFGGVGGAFPVLTIRVPIQPSHLVVGDNLIRFRMNFSDGRSIGFRVINFNLYASDGTSLIPQSEFEVEDPQLWKAPLDGISAYLEGEALWRTAPLFDHRFRDPLDSFKPYTMKARCSDCHAQSGKDLKYFAYSNRSIIERSKFHGLSEEQGKLIASYIRGLPSKSPGRPWNPLYQPGPGLSTRPGDELSAGAGIDWALDNDEQSLPYIFPNSDIQATHIAAEKDLQLLDVPIAYQLLTWNEWLPTVHPLDAFSGFTSANDPLPLYKQAALTLNNGYSATPSDAWYAAAYNAMYTLDFKRAWYQHEILSHTYPSQIDKFERIYSLALWHNTKLWEFVHEFALHDKGRRLSPFGHSAKSSLVSPLSWPWTKSFFNSAPSILKIDVSHSGQPAIGNGRPITKEALGVSWYVLQQILNDGGKVAQPGDPIDIPYFKNSPSSMAQIASTDSPNAKNPTLAMFSLLFHVRAIQVMNHPDLATASATTFPNAYLKQTYPQLVLNQSSDMLWQGYSPEIRASVTEALTRSWLNGWRRVSPAQMIGVDEINPSLTGIPPLDYDDLSTNDTGAIVLYSSLTRGGRYGGLDVRALGGSQALIDLMLDTGRLYYPGVDWYRVE